MLRIEENTDESVAFDLPCDVPCTTCWRDHPPAKPTA